jgi:hypothetical protein
LKFSKKNFFYFFFKLINLIAALCPLGSSNASTGFNSCCDSYICYSTNSFTYAVYGTIGIKTGYFQCAEGETKYLSTINSATSSTCNSSKQY